MWAKAEITYCSTRLITGQNPRVENTTTTETTFNDVITSRGILDIM